MSEDQPVEGHAIELFAMALTAAEQRSLEGLVEASLTGATPCGIWVERSYMLDSLVNPENYAITEQPAIDLVMLDSLDVPPGCVLHVMHFDGVLTRSVFEDRNLDAVG